MNKIQKKRLLLVAQALRESPNPKAFAMDSYAIIEPDATCGTPACALGHFAARRDLQNFLRLETPRDLKSYTYRFLNREADGTEPIGLRFVRNHGHRGTAPYNDNRIIYYFGLESLRDAEDLFGPEGCDRAKTPKGAARYIERFVAQHESR